ncbi:MAG: hypothetical protein HUJ22_03220 [Gracilimonas sp.]|uniref:hypothetical protein n=1 Tax=Gracilimonas sp. TaxID=1974203 RepID=UPI0019C2A560|nr:hypothetical protein [Gracilimonas sp.]MBD3615558.1 hypothetical protein [Gracilimonas sp.]
MKKKNKIEQELDRKEFENEIGRDLSSQYKSIEAHEKMHKDKNPYVIGAMNFFSTLFFFEFLYWMIKLNVNFFTYGFTVSFFARMDPFFHLAVLILCIYAVIQKKSVVEIVIDRWPF